MKPRKPLQKMGQGDEPPKTIAGKPADVCPYCGAAMFINGTPKGDSSVVTFPYVVCRCCKKSFKARREVKSVILYEVGKGDESSSSGNAYLTLLRESA